MAEMIPESISKQKKATKGEKKVFGLLRDALLPDDDYIVWYEAPTLGRYSDFIVFSQTFGIIIIEVKDWSIERIKKITTAHCTGFFHDENKEEVVQNPLAQARQYFSALSRSITRYDILTQDSGEYKGRSKIPIAQCVIFPNITKKDATEKGLLSDPAVLPENQVLFSDDLGIDPDDKEQRRLFLTRLKRTFNNHSSFTFDPLSDMELAALRQAIFPEIIIGQPKLFAEQKHSIKTLDIQQEKAAKNLGDGHRILKGVAGSGKSVVLACRAKYLRMTNPEWRILVVCFNISLLSSLRQHIFGSGSDEKTTITHFHGLAKNLIKASLRKNMSESGEEYNERVGKLIIESLEKEAEPIRYDAILIDEGQDFTDYWVKALTLILNPETNSILFCYDPAQNVFGRKRPNWKSVGLMVQGKRPTELKDCYRNTLQILRLANKFSNNAPDESIDDDETLTNKLTPNTHHCKEGSKPIIKQMTGHVDSIKYVIGAIQKATSSGKYSLKNIGVIVAHNKNWISTFAHEATQVLGADAVFDMTNQKHKMQLDLDHDSIKLMHVESCKGLEFSIVFLIGLEELPRLSRNNVDAERCLSYVGITRAQEHLFILGHKQHGFFQELQAISADA